MELVTGTISFCGKKALNVKSNEYKKYLLDILNERHNVIFNKRTYQTYKNTHKRMIERYGKNGILSIVSTGNAYLLYITKDEYSGTNRVFFIDCKVCDGYEYPRIVMIWMRFKEPLYIT